jgi:hypothetical protein
MTAPLRRKEQHPPELPACPDCSVGMILVRITPHKNNGIEDRLFECPRCGQFLTWVFKPLARAP